jgi:ribosomal protein S18 acetylase RimI-like enzyme
MTINDKILVRLREQPGLNLRAIEELTKFQDRARIFVTNENDPQLFSYLLISGHPSTNGRAPTIIMGGNTETAGKLLQYLPQSPYTVLETPREFLKILDGNIPQNSKVYHERRMEILRSDFKPVSTQRVRRLTESDDAALAKFNGAPAQAAASMRPWIKGAVALLGIFENGDLLSMGSTFCAVSDGWSLVSIKTDENHRRKGLGAEVVSALCGKAFDSVNAVQLTVLSDNNPAIALYQKLGFKLKEERVWIDCGSGSKPF